MKRIVLVSTIISLTTAAITVAQEPLGSVPADTASTITAVDSTTAGGSGTTTITMTKDGDNVTIVKTSGATADTVVREQSRRMSFRERMQQWREKGWGASFVAGSGLYAIGTRPVKDLIDRAAPLKGKAFSLNAWNYEPLYMSGGMGYFGIGNGARIGGAWMSGNRHFVSEPYAGDSAIDLDMRVSFGGFLMEKTVVCGTWNGIYGATIGGGGITVNARVIDHNVNSFFDRDTMDMKHMNDDGIKASFIYLDPHGGLTYTVAPFFHLGATINLPVFISPEGFESRTSDFMTVNPGIGVRFVFGNLG